MSERLCSGWVWKKQTNSVNAYEGWCWYWWGLHEKIVHNTLQWSLSASWDENRDLPCIHKEMNSAKTCKLKEDWTPDENLVLVGILISAHEAPGAENLVTLYPDFWIAETLTSGCCFKPLSCGDLLHSNRKIIHVYFISLLSLQSAFRCRSTFISCYWGNLRTNILNN